MEISSLHLTVKLNFQPKHERQNCRTMNLKVTFNLKADKFLYSLHACLFIQLLNLSFLTHEYFSFPLFYFLQMLCNKITAPKIKLAAYISSSIDTVCDFSQNGVLPPTNVSTLISYPIVCFFNVINLIIVLYLMICKYFEQCR